MRLPDDRKIFEYQIISIFLKQKSMTFAKKLLVVFAFLFLKASAQTCSFNLSTFSYTYGIYYLRSADYNNDGKKDLLCATQSSSLLCYLQTTPGNFSVNSSTYTGNFIGSGDLNNDGNVDFLTDTYFYGGQGNGTFTSSILSNSISGISVPFNQFFNNSENFKDFNNDGKLDLLVSGGLFLGTGTGNFNLPISLASVYVFDSGFIDGDNYLDIIYANSAQNNSTITVLKGVGNGSFTSVNNFTFAQSIGTIKLADLNNDTKNDIVLNNIIASTNSIVTFIGNGNNQFTLLNNYSVAITTTSTPAHFNVGDINNDGYIDIASLNYTMAPFGNNVPHNISIFYNNGSGSLLPPTIFTYSAGGNYIERLIIEDLNNDSKMDLAVCSWSSGIAATNNILFSNSNCIWPGDANGNGIANNSDILEIGLQFNQTGSARTSTNNIWDGYSYTAWTGSVSTGKNRAHADCNGDGTVNLNDTFAVFNNYGFMHNKIADIEMVNPDISIVPDQINVLKNTWGTASIFLGDASNNISNIHGVAFTVNYDNSIIETDSVWIEYTSSFINSNNLNFRKRVFSDGVIYTATTHTNQVNANGNGKIATLHYKIKPTLSSNTVLNLGISNGSKLSATAITSTLSTGNGTLNAVITDVGIKESSLNGQIIVYPNPSKGQLTIKQIDRGSFADFITIYNTTGQIVLSRKIESSTEKLDTHLSNGVYFYILSNSVGQIFKDKLIIE
jgi:hypothetical protein